MDANNNHLATDKAYLVKSELVDGSERLAMDDGGEITPTRYFHWYRLNEFEPGMKPLVLAKDTWATHLLSLSKGTGDRQMLHLLQMPQGWENWNIGESFLEVYEDGDKRQPLARLRNYSFPPARGRQGS